MRAVARDAAPCRTGRGLAASRRPFGDARSPVRHGAEAEPPPCHQAILSKKEVLTFNRDLTSQVSLPPFSCNCGIITPSGGRFT